MRPHRCLLPRGLVLMLSLCAQIALGQETEYLSHPPIRPLPVASHRPMSPGHASFVDGKKGDDTNPGTEERPWQSIAHAVTQLKPGDVLYLRGGTYYEHITLTAQGTSDRPITIRSMPGELVVLDGGLREFFESPATAWEPYTAGAPDEYRSTKTYPALGGSADGTNLLGNFGDSMVPLHGYRYQSDLRTGNEYFANIDAGKTEAGDGVYCGPGLLYDVESARIHVRLSHTTQKALGENNYRGETDARKLPLIIAGANAGSALTLDGARFVRVQDLAVRGARIATITIKNSHNIEFDGVTAYGGASAMSVSNTQGLRLWNCACRGIAAPWTYRGSLKYRAIEARIFSASGWAPTGTDNSDFELAYSEFTDCVDGVFIGNVRNVQFHHNLVENVSDDGMFLTATTAYDGSTHGGNVAIYQNRISRCLTSFAFGVGHGRQKMTERGRQTGEGVWILRNVFDFRQPVMYAQPAEDEEQLTSYGRIAGDHGSPLWEPMTIYHNTILQVETPYRGYYLGGLGGGLGGGSYRRLFNNIVVHTLGPPGRVLPPVVPPLTKAEITEKLAEANPPSSPLTDLLEGDLGTKPDEKKKIAKELNSSELGDLKKELSKKAQPELPLQIDFQADGNLHWSYVPDFAEVELFADFKESPEFDASKRLYRPGWTAHDVVADPRFVSFHSDWQQPVDLRLAEKSLARAAGATIDSEWFDPLRSSDDQAPDLGAFPVGTPVWNVGMHGRLDAFGTPNKSVVTTAAPKTLLIAKQEPRSPTPKPKTKPAVIVEGYPAFDAPLVQFCLRQHGQEFEGLTRTWLEPANYDQYSLVVIVGDLPRAKIQPNVYSAVDIEKVKAYLEGGGTLLLMRGNHRLFSIGEGREFLSAITGIGKASSEPFEILLPQHPWVSHLKAKQVPEWIYKVGAESLRFGQGEAVIGNKKGNAMLYLAKVGQGNLIYLGWDISASLPHGRSSSTVQEETNYEQQMQILKKIVESIYVWE